MTLLSDVDIMEERRLGNIIINPYNPSDLQPASYDIHLGNTLLIPEFQAIGSGGSGVLVHSSLFNPIRAFDPSEDEQPLKSITLPTKDDKLTMYLPPGGVALGCTQELLTLNGEAPIAADIAGCSGLGRWWLQVHMTAGFIDNGWSGKLTLELYNASPWWLRIWEDMRIAQIRFWETRSAAQRSYVQAGHYAWADSVQASRYKG